MINLKKTLMTLMIGTVALAMSGTANALVVVEIESNDTFAMAQNIDAYFSLDFSPNIGDTFSNTSTTNPHVTIQGTGDLTYDVYSFSVQTEARRGIFDIDFGRDVPGGLTDAWLDLFNAQGTRLAFDDDAPTSYGQGGSIHVFDSYLESDLIPGSYFIRVGHYRDNNQVDGTYELQVSLAPVPEPHNYALMLAGLGMLGFVARRHQRKLAAA